MAAASWPWGTDDFTSVPNGVYLVNSADGTIAAKLNTGGTVFAQTIFAGKYLFATAGGRGITAYPLP